MDATGFFKPRATVQERPLRDEYHHRVDNWRVTQQFDTQGNHRLIVSNRSKVVESKWCSPEEFACVDLDKDFGSQRGWSIYGCCINRWWNVFGTSVFKVQTSVIDESIPAYLAKAIGEKVVKGDTDLGDMAE